MLMCRALMCRISQVAWSPSLEAGPLNYTKVLKETRVLDDMMADLTALIAKI